MDTMNRKTLLLAATALLTATNLRAFNNTGWKKNDDGTLATDASGNPIYVQADGKEQSVQSNTIGRLNDEARNHRTAKEEAEKKLLAYGDLDPAKAREAIDKLSKVDLTKMVENGELEKVRSEITAQFTTQLNEQKKGYDDVSTQRDELRRQLEFSKSEFIQKRIAVPNDMFEATFGRNFKTEEGKLVPYDNAGNKIMSPTRFGETANVDEAFEILVNAHPHKDSILKAESHSGTGGNGGGGGRGGNRSITREEFAKMTPVDQAAAAAAMGKGELIMR